MKEAKKALVNGETRQKEGRVKTKICQITAQIDALTSRLSELPKEVSAAPIYKQMQKLEATKADLDARLAALKRQAGEREEVVGLETYGDFLAFLTRLSGKGLKPENRHRVIERLIYRIELFRDSIKIHYVVGSAVIKREPDISSSLESSNFSAVECSTRLTSGGKGSAKLELVPVVVSIEFEQRWVRRRKIDPQELVTLRESGLTLREIGAHYGYAHSTVVDLLRKAYKETAHARPG